MFIGHFAPAMVAATHKDAPNLPTLFVAAQLVDWAFFGFVLSGVEHMRITPGFTAMNAMDLYDMPYTHSLVGALAFGLGTTVVIWALAHGNGNSIVVWPRAARDGNGNTIVIWPRAVMAGFIGGLVVVSHWLLDVLVHTKDMSIAGGTKFGLGLWNQAAIEMPLEVGIVAIGLWLYARATGGWRLSLTVLAVVLALLQGMNWFGPQPDRAEPGGTYLAWFAFGLATLCAWWAARTERRSRV